MEGMLYFKDFFYINVVNLIFFESQKNTILQGKWSKKIFGMKRVNIQPEVMQIIVAANGDQTKHMSSEVAS